MKTEVPMSRSHLLSKVDTLAQCTNPQCRRIFSIDGLDIMMSMRSSSPLICGGCESNVSLYQNLESLFVNE